MAHSEIANISLPIHDEKNGVKSGDWFDTTNDQRLK